MPIQGCTGLGKENCTRYNNYCAPKEVTGDTFVNVVVSLYFFLVLIPFGLGTTTNSVKK